MEFLKECVFNNISFGKVWWSSRNPIIIVGGCGGLKRNSFLTVSPLGGVVVFNGLIFTSSSRVSCS